VNVSSGGNLKNLLKQESIMTDTGKCPAFGYDCEYVAKVEAQAAEIKRLREALWNIAHHTSVRTAKECWEEARAALGEAE